MLCTAAKLRAPVGGRPAHLQAEGPQHGSHVFSQANAYTLESTAVRLGPVAALVCADVLVQALTPEKFSCIGRNVWGPCVGARVVRLFWAAASLGVLSLSASTAPATALLASVMFAMTATTDIFFRSPVLLAHAKWRKCFCRKHGWFSCLDRRCVPAPYRGLPRLGLALWALVTGLGFLKTAIEAHGAFASQRDRDKADVVARALSSDQPRWTSHHQGQTSRLRGPRGHARATVF